MSLLHTPSRSHRPVKLSRVPKRPLTLCCAGSKGISYLTFLCIQDPLIVQEGFYPDKSVMSSACKMLQGHRPMFPDARGTWKMMLAASHGLLIGCLVCAWGVHALDNGVGRTPAMGWNRWASKERPRIYFHALCMHMRVCVFVLYNGVGHTPCPGCAWDGDMCYLMRGGHTHAWAGQQSTANACHELKTLCFCSGCSACGVHARMYKHIGYATALRGVSPWAMAICVSLYAWAWALRASL